MARVEREGSAELWTYFLPGSMKGTLVEDHTMKSNVTRKLDVCVYVAVTSQICQLHGSCNAQNLKMIYCTQ